jgi:hypothetical protein
VVINNLFPIDVADEFRLCREAFIDDEQALKQLERAQDRIQTLLRMKPESVEKMLAFWPIPVFTEVGIVPLCQWRRNCWD